uniref:CD302 molecule n=1 Tax=Hippocampus comes TaxID=109280 RepID=A0A3Q2Z326_HIPCM
YFFWGGGFSHHALSADCPSDGRTWVPFKDRCYHFVHGEEDKLKVYNFESAKSLCPHSELLSIQSAEENDFVVKYSPEVWKGEVNVWLGMYYDTNSEGMMWFDEEPVKFTNWEPGSSPSDFVPMETCVAVHSDTGKWERVSCLDDLENGVVCETAQKSSGLLSGLVILCIIAIVAVSVVLWFLHQRQHPGSSVVTGFEYHPPFRAPDGDRSCLVEAEELDGGP